MAEFIGMGILLLTACLLVIYLTSWVANIVVYIIVIRRLRKRVDESDRELTQAMEEFKKQFEKLGGRKR